MARSTKAKVQKGGDLQLPQSRIMGAPGSNYVIIDLMAGESIKSSPGSLIYMRGDVEKGEVEVGGIGKAFARMLGGENFVITTYRGGAYGGAVAFGISLPGDIIYIDLGPQQEIIISRGSFLCCTPGLEITATTRMQGALGVGQGEGFVLPVIKAGAEGGRVWLAAYGSFERIDLSTNETAVLDNGTFLSCPTSLNYKVVKLGKTILSSLAGGEGLGMEFTGPASLYIQSKNINDLQAMAGSGSGNTVSSTIGKSIFKNMFSTSSSGGAKRKVAKTPKSN